MTTPFERALAGYDQEHENALVEAIFRVICERSIISDDDGRRVMALGTGEIASALANILVMVIGLSPTVTRSPAVLCKFLDHFGKGLRRQIAKAEANPAFRNFYARAFHGNAGRERGGSA